MSPCKVSGELVHVLTVEEIVVIVLWLRTLCSRCPFHQYVKWWCWTWILTARLADLASLKVFPMILKCFSMFSVQTNLASSCGLVILKRGNARTPLIYLFDVELVKNWNSLVTAIKFLICQSLVHMSLCVIEKESTVALLWSFCFVVICHVMSFKKELLWQWSCTRTFIWLLICRIVEALHSLSCMTCKLSSNLCHYTLVL